jgi:melibiose permease
MIPAVTDTPADRESLSVVGRTCAGVGSAIIQVGTLISVGFLGNGSERAGFARVALIVSVIFIITEVICCAFVKERQDANMETTSVGEMFRSLFHNDQAMVTVLAILLINCSLYLTSNLIIYFFKYDMGGTGWKGNYTLFTTVGGAFQILGMMILYPALRKKHSNTALFRIALGMAICGYILILLLCLTGLGGNLPLLCVCGILVFSANGILSVLTTVFLSNSADYGELKTGRREESVIFSMQTFVVKAASGIAVFLTGIGLDLIGLVGNTDETGPIAVQSASTILGLRLLMTILPIIGLLTALVFFQRKFLLTDQKVEEMANTLQEKRNAT